VAADDARIIDGRIDLHLGPRFLRGESFVESDGRNPYRSHRGGLEKIAALLEFFCRHRYVLF